jgi:hypothetical protein
MAVCFVLVKRCQHHEARLDYPFDWTSQFARKWIADHAFGAGVAIRPPGAGYEFFSSGGTSGAEEPAWNQASHTDGSITWTRQVLSFASMIERVVSDSWTVDESGLLLEPETPTDTVGLQLTNAYLSLGAIDAEYTVDNEVLTDQGREYIARIVMTIE